jgi:hypothetical protein
MVWNEYAHAAERMSDNEYTDDEEYEIELNKPLHIDDWGGHYDDDLWWMWNLLKRYVRDRYAEHHFLKDAKYHDFIEFCYRFSDHRAIEL